MLSGAFSAPTAGDWRNRSVSRLVPMVLSILPVTRKPEGFSGFHPAKGQYDRPFCARFRKQCLVPISGCPAGRYIGRVLYEKIRLS